MMTHTYERGATLSEASPRDGRTVSVALALATMGAGRGLPARGWYFIRLGDAGEWHLLHQVVIAEQLHDRIPLVLRLERYSDAHQSRLQALLRWLLAARSLAFLDQLPTSEDRPIWRRDIDG